MQKAIPPDFLRKVCLRGCDLHIKPGNETTSVSSSFVSTKHRISYVLKNDYY